MDNFNVRRFSSGFAGPVVLLLCVSPVLCGRGFAQNSLSPQAQWSKLLSVKPSIVACRVTWKRVVTFKPKPMVDPEKRAAQALASALKQGFSKEEAQRQSQGERQEALKDIDGRVITTLLNFVRIGNLVRCDILEPESGNRTLEFFDGTNILSATVEVAGKKRTIDANLTRDTNEVLLMSAGGEQIARSLLSIPFTDQFSPSNPALASEDLNVKDKKLEVTLERKFDTHVNAKEPPVLWTIDSSSGQPISYQEFNINGILANGVISREKGKLNTRIDIGNYRKYPGGISFPSKVIVTKPTITKEYTLIKAAFNEAVDVEETRLPPMRITDGRFGYGDNAVVYNLKDGKIPSDAEVRTMLGSKKEKDEEQGKAETTRTTLSQAASLIMPSTIGLMLLCLSAMLWSRSNKL